MELLKEMEVVENFICDAIEHENDFRGSTDDDPTEFYIESVGSLNEETLIIIEGKNGKKFHITIEKINDQ